MKCSGRSPASARGLRGRRGRWCGSRGRCIRGPRCSRQRHRGDRAPPWCADAGVLPQDAQCTGLYSDLVAKTVAAGARPYAPAVPFWSDGAHKERWDLASTQHEDRCHRSQRMDLPVGTKLWKEFSRNGKRVETRLWQKVREMVLGFSDLRVEPRRNRRRSFERWRYLLGRRRVPHSDRLGMREVPPRAQRKYSRLRAGFAGAKRSNWADPSPVGDGRADSPVPAFPPLLDRG